MLSVDRISRCRSSQVPWLRFFYAIKTLMNIPWIPGILMMTLVGYWRLNLHLSDRSNAATNLSCTACLLHTCRLFTQTMKQFAIDNINNSLENWFLINSWSSHRFHINFLLPFRAISNFGAVKTFQSSKHDLNTPFNAITSHKGLPTIETFFSSLASVSFAAESFLNTKLTASGNEREISPHSNIMICWWWQKRISK